MMMKRPSPNPQTTPRETKTPLQQASPKSALKVANTLTMKRPSNSKLFKNAQQASQKAIINQEAVKHHQKELLAQIWVSTEQGATITCMQILKNEEPELAEALLNQQNSDGWTPLHVASNEGHVDLIELFVEFGGSVDARSRNFRTPLHIASIRGNLSVIQAVLMAGADINAKDIDGNTPCHFSSEYGHKDCLRYLLLKHPSLINKNKENQSPLDVAVNTEILQVSVLNQFPD
jgi:ankyrin repeat protein